MADETGRLSLRAVITQGRDEAAGGLNASSRWRVVVVNTRAGASSIGGAASDQGCGLVSAKPQFGRG